VTFLRYPTVSWDAFAERETVAGLVGGDLLRHFAFTADYRGGRVWLSRPFDPAARPADVSTASEIRLPLELLGGGRRDLPGDCSPTGCGTIELPATRVVVQATFEGLPAPEWVVIDTGTSFVILDEALLAVLGDLDRRPLLDGVLVSTIDGDRPALLSRVWRLRLEGGGAAIEVEDLPVALVPGASLLAQVSAEIGRPARALIGGSLLRHHLTTLDYPRRQLRLARYDDQDHVPADEFIGVGLSLEREGDDWVAAEVFTNRDAWRKGVRPGDVVESVDGMPIGGQPGEVVDRAFARFAVGEEVPLEIRRGSALELVRVLFEDLLPSYPPPGAT
jgi:hypothetical protein